MVKDGYLVPFSPLFVVLRLRFSTAESALANDCWRSECDADGNARLGVCMTTLGYAESHQSGRRKRKLTKKALAQVSEMKMPKNVIMCNDEWLTTKSELQFLACKYIVQRV